MSKTQNKYLLTNNFKINSFYNSIGQLNVNNFYIFNIWLIIIIINYIWKKTKMLVNLEVAIDEKKVPMSTRNSNK